jgi:hypothetical protein
MKTFALALLTVCVSASASVNTPMGLVAEGDLDRLSQKITVRISRKYMNSYAAVCSGVIVGPTQVLTASHCFDADQTLPLSAYVIEYRDPKDPQKWMRAPFAQLPKMGDEVESDLTLIQVKTPFQGIDRTAPLGFSGCAPESPYVTRGFGYDGKTRMTSDSRSAVYRAMDRAEIFHRHLDNLPLTDREGHELRGAALKEAQKKFFEYFEENGRVYLASVKGRACPGDSGGPVFCRKDGRWVIAGVAGIIQMLDASKPNPNFVKKPVNCRDTALLIMNSVGVKKTADQIQKWLHEDDIKPAENPPGAGASQ